MFLLRSLTVVLGAGISLSAAALEYPIGTPYNLAGMEIAAVYLQAVDMEPEGHMRKAAESDIHLEVDIHALANNPNGFPEGFWLSLLFARSRLPGPPVSGYRRETNVKSLCGLAIQRLFDG